MKKEGTAYHTYFDLKEINDQVVKINVKISFSYLHIRWES
jgi:hypothetical protein